MDFYVMKASASDEQVLYDLLVSITISLSRYAVLVLVILGTVGNIINIIVFSQQKLRTSPCTIYFFTSACIDLIITLAINLPRVLTTYNLDLSATVSILCRLRQFFYFNLSSLSIWMATLATIDRFLISSPLTKRRQMSSFRNTYRLIAASLILLTLIFGDLFYCADIAFNGVLSSCSASSSKTCGYYNQIARLVTLLFMPEILIMVFSIGIIRNLKSLKIVPRTAARAAAHEYRIRKTDRELMKLLICQIVLLTISFVPLGVQRIYALITADVKKSALRKAIEALSEEISSNTARFECSLSCYVYLFAGGALFRQTLLEWLKRITDRGIIAPISGTAGSTIATAN